MSATTTPKIASVAPTERHDAKLDYIIRLLDEMPTRFHLMAVAAAAGGFWVVVTVVAVAFLR